MCEPTLRVAISSRALFDLEAEDRIFREDGLAAYLAHQRAHEQDPPAWGTGYPLIRKLLGMNRIGRELVEVLIVSRNNPHTGLRVGRSLASSGLPIERRVFTAGRPTYPYLEALGVHFFLTASEEDARDATAHGIPSAVVLPSLVPQEPTSGPTDGELRIAFDGDCCLFGSESERFFQRVHAERGLEAALAEFNAEEARRSLSPMSRGPMAAFLESLARLREGGCQIRTALITARSAPADERPVRTLESWGLEVDEFLALGGLPKAPFLGAFGADLFFDDQDRHLDLARHVVPSARVLLATE